MKRRKLGRKDQKWDVHYRSLVRFVSREGHARVPARQEVDGFRLGRWVLRQRQARDDLTPERMGLLQKIEGWCWSGQGAKWDMACVLLEQFAKREGHACVPKLHIEDDFKLGVWVMHQREKYRRGALSKERQRYLEKVTGWDWYGKPNKLPKAGIDEIAEGVWSSLFGRGIVSDSIAFHVCLNGLYDMGLIRSNHAHINSPLADIVKKGMKEAGKLGYLDAPKHGFVRAILKDSKDYTIDDWRMCIVNSLYENPVDRSEAIETAVMWAKQNMGLESAKLGSNTPIFKNIEKALYLAIKNGEIKRVGRFKVAAY